MTKAERAHKAMLSERACVICERLYGQHPGGNVELHHLRSGGWGKGDYRQIKRSRRRPLLNDQLCRER